MRLDAEVEALALPIYAASGPLAEVDRRGVLAIRDVGVHAARADRDVALRSRADEVLVDDRNPPVETAVLPGDDWSRDDGGTGGYGGGLDGAHDGECEDNEGGEH